MNKALVFFEELNSWLLNHPWWLAAAVVLALIPWAFFWLAWDSERYFCPRCGNNGHVRMVNGKPICSLHGKVNKQQSRS